MNLPTRLFVCLCLIGKSLLPASAFGQSYPYVVDFESVSTQPSSKSYASTDTITIDQLGWVMPGVYLGYALGSDFKIDNRSCRIRLSNNTSGTPGYLCMVQDLPYGIDSVSFYTAMYGSESGGKLILEYSTNQGNTWQAAGDTIIVPDSSAPLWVKRDLSLSGNVRIAIRKADPSNERINIDQIRITNQDTVITDLALQTFFPVGPGINPYTRTLYWVFEDSVVLHEGEVRLHPSEGAIQPFNLGTDSIFSTAGDTVFLSDISLQPNTDYYITFDSAAFQSMDGYKISKGIRDSLRWTFSTWAGSVSSLDESFLYCDSGHLGIFYAWNIMGAASWVCNDTTGSAAPPSVGLHPKAADSVVELDYLISKLPLDLSGMVAPQLHFMEKKDGTGHFKREVLYSTNYKGGNPQDSPVQWQPLLKLDSIGQVSVWLSRQASLEQLMHQPFFLAFRYQSPAGAPSGGWSLDAVRVTEFTSAIHRPERTTGYLQVVGEATMHEIVLRFQVEKEGPADISLYDITGHCRHRQRIYCQPGTAFYRIYPGQLHPGMYIIQVRPEGSPTYRSKVSIYR